MSEDHFSGSPGKHCLTEKCLTVFDFRISQDFPENKNSRLGKTGVPKGVQLFESFLDGGMVLERNLIGNVHKKIIANLCIMSMEISPEKG